MADQNSAFAEAQALDRQQVAFDSAGALDKQDATFRVLKAAESDQPNLLTQAMRSFPEAASDVLTGLKAGASGFYRGGQNLLLGLSADARRHNAQDPVAQAVSSGAAALGSLADQAGPSQAEFDRLRGRGIPGKVYSAVGAAPYSVAKYSSPALTAVTSAAENANKPLGEAAASVTRDLMGQRVFSRLAALSRPVAAATGAAYGAAQAKAEGGSATEGAVTGGIVAGGLPGGARSTLGEDFRSLGPAARGAGAFLSGLRRESSTTAKPLRGGSVFEPYVRNAGARGDAQNQANTRIAEIEKILPDPKDQAAFGRIVRHMNEEAVSKSRAVRDLPTVAPELSADDAAAIQSRPAIADALEHVAGPIQADFAAVNEAAGVANRRDTPFYLKLVREQENPTPGSSPFLRQGTRAAQTAKEATATAGHTDDWRSMLRATYTDKYLAAGANNLAEAVKSSGVSAEDVSRGTVAAPATLPYGGKDYPAQRVNVTTGLKPGSYYVPEPVATAWNNIEVKPPSVLDKPIGVNVGTTLLSVAEPVIHLRTVLQAAARTPMPPEAPLALKVASQLRIPGLLPWMLQPRNIVPVIRALGLEPAEFGELSGTLIKFGGNRPSNTSGLESPGWLEELQGLPVIKQAKQAVFGRNGMEIRLRSLMLKDMRITDPHLTDAERVDNINNEVGAYVRQLRPQLASNLRAWDTFATTGIAALKGSAKGLAGISTSGRFSGAVAAGGSLPAIAAYYILTNKANDPQHRWPWQIDSLKPGDMIDPKFSTKDRLVTQPISAWAPDAGRFLTALGASNAITDLGKGRFARAAGDVAQGPVDYAIERAGPPARAALALATGKAAYVTPQGDLLQLAKKSMNAPLAERLKSAEQQIVPWGKIEKFNEPTTRKIGTPAGNLAQLLGEYTGAQEKVMPPEAQAQRLAAAQVFDKAEAKDVATQIASEYRRVRESQGVDAAREYALKELDRRIDPKVLPYARQQFMRALGIWTH